MKWPSILVIVVVVVLGAYFFLNRGTKTTMVPAISPEGTPTETKVEVTKTDVSNGGTSSLPAGFPSDIPVETNNLTESYRANYADHGVVQYAVSYTSLKTRDELWTLYANFMNKANYTIDKNTTAKSLGQLSGTQDKSSLSIIISDHSGLSLVQINYLKR